MLVAILEVFYNSGERRQSKAHGGEKPECTRGYMRISSQHATPLWQAQQVLKHPLMRVACRLPELRDNISYSLFQALAFHLEALIGSVFLSFFSL